MSTQDFDHVFQCLTLVRRHVIDTTGRQGEIAVADFVADRPVTDVLWPHAREFERDPAVLVDVDDLTPLFQGTLLSSSDQRCWSTSDS
jgi:hypothetical protein